MATISCFRMAAFDLLGGRARRLELGRAAAIESFMNKRPLTPSASPGAAVRFPREARALSPQLWSIRGRREQRATLLYSPACYLMDT